MPLCEYEKHPWTSVVSLAYQPNSHICFVYYIVLIWQEYIHVPFAVLQIFNQHSFPNDLLGDYCDGKQFKSNPLFGHVPHPLQIILYYDEVELCNPFGSYTKTHKLGDFVIHLTWACSSLNNLITGLFYYLLGNIFPRLRAGLNSIQVLCAVKSSVIKEYGMNEILRPFVADVLKLEEVCDGL